MAIITRTVGLVLTRALEYKARILEVDRRRPCELFSRVFRQVCENGEDSEKFFRLQVSAV